MLIEENDNKITDDGSNETIEELSKEMEDCINQKMRAIADYQNLKRKCCPYSSPFQNIQNHGKRIKSHQMVPFFR